MDIEINEAAQPPPRLREAYFGSLGGEPQVHHLERSVSVARTFLLGPASAPFGYLAAHDGVVVEFWASDDALPRLGALFYAAATHAGATSAVVKSYDTLALVAPGEAAQDLAGGRITIHEMDGAPVGCGIRSPVREGADAVDLGVGILPQWRRKGFGEQIVRHLKQACLRDLNVRPVCGCAVENIASRRTLERAGFLTRHRLLELRWAV